MAELRAVTVDLDDTLFPQADWLSGAWAAVAAVAEAFGFNRLSFRESLLSFAAEGSDKGCIIDRALIAAGVDDPAPLLPALVSAFSGWAPSAMMLYPDASDALARLRSAGLGIAIITDGSPQIQRSKLAALGLAGLVDHVVISDEIGGRATRKPSPVPFLRALELCGTTAAGTVHVGDRPAKDVAGAAAAGMRAVRVRTGEYAEIPDSAADAAPWATADSFAEAVDLLLA
jgi:putative hydrolase of the HAD superfamily